MMWIDKPQDEPVCLCRNCGGEMYEGEFGWDFGSEGIWCDDCVDTMSAWEHKQIFDHADKYERVEVRRGSN